MASRRKQEERLVNSLRELAGLPQNKHCFDCAQRGPTYLNMTIGSFVCTSCSGILRGLNPPHRVKSISMATFSQDEVDFIKARGNEYCRRIWLGLYDGDSRPYDAGYKDENHTKDFLVTKYEKKRWYVSPSEVARQQTLLEKAQAGRVVTTGSSSATPNGSSPPDHLISTPSSPPAAFSPSSGGPVDSLVDTSPPPAPSQTFGPPSAASQAIGQQKQSSVTAGSSLFDGDPFAPSNTHDWSSPQNGTTVRSTGDGGGFANFDVLNMSNLTKSHTAPNMSEGGQAAVTHAGGGQLNFLQPTTFAQPVSHQPNPTPSVPIPDAGQLQPTVSSKATPVSIKSATPISAGDKYSALAELDELFHTSSSPPNSGPTATYPSAIDHMHSNPSGGVGYNMSKSQSAFGALAAGPANQLSSSPAACSGGFGFPGQQQHVRPPTQYANPFMPGVGPGVGGGGVGVAWGGGVPHQHPSSTAAQFPVQGSFGSAYAPQPPSIASNPFLGMPGGPPPPSQPQPMNFNSGASQFPVSSVGGGTMAWSGGYPMATGNQPVPHQHASAYPRPAGPNMSGSAAVNPFAVNSPSGVSDAMKSWNPFL